MALGRNQPCPCGSGKKYKHCCGAPDRLDHRAAASPESSAEGFAQTLTRANGLLQAGQYAQAEEIYRQILAEDPDDARATHFLGMCLFRAGRPDEAMAALRRSVELAPSNDTFWLNFGIVFIQSNQPGEAETALRHALSAKPDSAAAHNYLGIALLRAGRYEEAVASFERALALNPQDDNIHNSFGFARLEHGEVEAACAHFRRAIEINPRNMMAHNNLGNALRAHGDMAASMASYRCAVEIQPGNPMARYYLGRALVEDGQTDAALEHLRTAVQLKPQVGEIWQCLAAALAQRRFDAHDAGIEDELAECLARPDIAPEELGPAAASLLRADPPFRLLLTRSAREGVDALPLDETILRKLARPLFLLLLENVIVQELNFEQLITKMRRAAILAWDAGKLDGGAAPGSAALRDVLGAIAHQCFLTEYLHEERDDEAPIVLQLKAAVEADLAQGGPVNEAQLALLACYLPLATVQRADTLPASDASIASRLVLRQVREPADEAAIALGLRQLTPISDEVSRAVQAQYEERPYPRWSCAPSTEGVQPLALRLRRVFPHADKAGTVPQHPSILIAGCGTGWHVALTAPPNPDSRILAIDLSRASLAYAARRAQQIGIKNVEFAQADILELGGLEERFDLIECAGVLHHLHDPVAGWRVLTGLLAPGGRMKVGLYSEIARRGIVAARRLIAERGFAADLRGVRAARAAILALPRDDPARQLARTVDFYTLSGCRDLLFHVQELRYTLTGIEAILGDLGLDFLGFEFESEAALLEYRSEFPLDSLATSLANWSEFETRHPDTFNAMYQFWVRQKDEPRL